jgi:hypothetical protein
MPQVKDGPQALNTLLEKVFKSCMDMNNDSTLCSKESWSAAKKAGWSKGSDGKWSKK